ncbi:hypothetical protein KTN05_17470, partial [Paracoccus sp. Z118]|uniref:hypothetical protein n=1 Tax=Paracoccus sp. Z118 TaxID=2851017 RepID=UPI001C2C708E
MNLGYSLRTRLRDDTRLAHERVDAAYRFCDIAAPWGLSLFLSDHLQAFASLSIADGPRRLRAEALRTEYCAALQADLAALGCAARHPRKLLQVTPIPVLYILLGSRRGAQMMQR